MRMHTQAVTAESVGALSAGITARMARNRTTTRSFIIAFQDFKGEFQ
jgi:hypothetical protein